MRVVHIGFPKTATSWLQQVVFPQLPRNFLYFDKQASAAVFGPLVNRDDTVFDGDGLKAALEDAWRGASNALFSYELLTGLHHHCAFVNRTLIARRLKMAGFERVIITIRNQFDALESSYKQYVKSGGVLKFDEYVDLESSEPKYLYPEYFDYFSIYRLYAETFGVENVLVLQYEHLRTAGFLRQLAEFLGIQSLDGGDDTPINTSLSCDKTKILRVINHETYNSYRPSHLISNRISTSAFYRLLSAAPVFNRPKSFLSTQRRVDVAAFYAESNQRLRDAGITLASEYA